MCSCTALAVLPFHFSLSAASTCQPPLLSLFTSPYRQPSIVILLCYPFPLLPIGSLQLSSSSVIPFHFSVSAASNCHPPLLSLSTSPYRQPPIVILLCYPFPLLPIGSLQLSSSSAIPFHFSLSAASTCYPFTLLHIGSLHLSSSSVIPFNCSLSAASTCHPLLLSFSTSPYRQPPFVILLCYPFPLLPIGSLHLSSSSVIPFHFSLSAASICRPPLLSLSTSPYRQPPFVVLLCYPFPLLLIGSLHLSSSSVILFHFSLSAASICRPPLLSLSTSPYRQPPLVLLLAYLTSLFTS